MSFTIDSALSIFPDTQVADALPAIVKSFNQLNAEDQLALLWFAYTEMGLTITPAAMQAVNMVFAEKNLTQIKQMPALEQTQVMCDLVNHTDTPICRTYASFGTNVKLGFWYQLSEWMKQTIVAPIPENYQLSTKASDLLQAIRKLEGGEQLTVFQKVVINMGYASTSSTPKVTEPVVPPKKAAPRSQVRIKGIDNATVLSYMENMNAFDFQAAVALFVKEGALKPPFQEPIVGQENIFAYMRQECYGLKLLPEQGVCEPAEGEFTQIKVTGKVQTPWFGDSVGINLVWRFLLNPEDKIFFVGIDVLGSPQELLNLGLVQNNAKIELP
ncbi:orange carotenoid protein N-terminal domain-containing protein [Merismopedia glauca]|uniref:Red carotenoid-binding protein n=1 Tax=Merismopedia glauca CCAP 1448/3 TaxID=1296344 RepID=A0A2T1C4U4_9CYAN|nr:orange carotenoid protein N-terminal domain-containing protein [Merismopedia glauca]PSB03302.1 Red carotenoid-binding protein [Merismopedia glauca CCAP 1448/3]